MKNIFLSIIVLFITGCVTTITSDILSIEDMKELDMREKNWNKVVEYLSKKKNCLEYDIFYLGEQPINMRNFRIYACGKVYFCATDIIISCKKIIDL